MLKRVIPKTGKQVSRLGFGGFRVSQPIHAQALINALEGGINIIDTGSNFENGTIFINQFYYKSCLKKKKKKGASESLIGDTMDTLIQSKKLNREVKKKYKGKKGKKKKKDGTT
jgi:aryl-alcohol dehydrogenase-like predicted oxidoreductase